jgi:hypothetical protein
MGPFSTLDWPGIRAHYDRRVVVHQQLIALHREGPSLAFARLLIGLSDPIGNYSANQHGLGPRILASNPRAAERLHALADKFLALQSAHEVPTLIHAANLAYFKVGVGSEASCMMNPNVCWVSNVRTIWTHLLIKHADQIKRANEELSYYRDDEADGEMIFKLWAAIHREMDTAMTRIAERAANLCRNAGIIPGPIKYLWADAVADALYSAYAD